MNSETVATFIGDNTAWTYNPTTAGSTIFADYVPDRPNACVSVMTFGGDTFRDMGSPEASSTFQVRVRGERDNRYSPSEATAELARLFYETVTPATWGSDRVIDVKVSLPYQLGIDVTDRPEWAFRITIRHAY